MSHQTCWFHRFAQEPCARPGRWRAPEAGDLPEEWAQVAEGVKQMRWCDDHKHPGDVLVDPHENTQKDGA